MTKDELDNTLNTYSWIKVKRYEDDPSLSWEERYKRLEEHHMKETDFLIKKVRELAEECYRPEGYVSPPLKEAFKAKVKYVFRGDLPPLRYEI